MAGRIFARVKIDCRESVLPDSYGAKAMAGKKEKALPAELQGQKKRLDEQIKKAAARLTLGGDKG